MVPNGLRFGIGFPNRGILFGSTTVAELYEFARIVDRTAAFHSFWVGDSLLSKPRVESIACLGAVAALTSRVRIGPACFASFPLRDPLTLAIQWASLDVLAGGRTTLVVCIGAGAGWSGDWATEFRAYHADPGERVARMVESMAVLRRLWTEERVTHEGRFWQFADVELLPKPLQQPYPIWIANNVRGPADSDLVQKALRRVARLADGWQTAVIWPRDFTKRWQMLQSFLPEYGKDPASYPNSMYYNVNFNVDKAAAREETLTFLKNYYLTRDYPEPAFDAWSAWGEPSAVIERLEGYVEAGVQEFIIRFPSWEMRRQLDTFMDQVLPHFQARLQPAAPRRARVRAARGVRYIGRRLLEAIPVLLGISIISFLVVRLAPGDPVALLVDVNQLSPDQLAEVRRGLGLDDPLPVQYVRMLGALLMGQLTSFRTGQSTIQMVLEAAPITLLLVFTTVVSALVIGVLLGVISALRPYSRTDNVVTGLSLFGLSVPQFWLGLVLILIFAEILGWLPASGVRPVGAAGWNVLEMIPYLILPTAVLASGMIAALTRYTRSGMLEVLGLDYVRTARAKGLSERRVLVGHALRNALVTIVTLTGVLIPILLSGSVVVENVFAVPGMGRLAVNAAVARDYPLVMTVNLLSAALVLAFNLLTDLAYTAVDPRIRVGE